MAIFPFNERIISLITHTHTHTWRFSQEEAVCKALLEPNRVKGQVASSPLISFLHLRTQVLWQTARRTHTDTHSLTHTHHTHGTLRGHLGKAMRRGAILKQHITTRVQAARVMRHADSDSERIKMRWWLGEGKTSREIIESDQTLAGVCL